MELKQLIKQQKAKGVLVKTLAHPSLVIMAQDCGMDLSCMIVSMVSCPMNSCMISWCLAICESFHPSSELHSWQDQMYPEFWITVQPV